MGGTGLGLAIAMEDANLHNGWLTAWGRPGLGAQFRLTVPRKAGGILQQSPLPLVPRDIVGLNARLGVPELPYGPAPSAPSPGFAPWTPAESTPATPSTPAGSTPATPASPAAAPPSSTGGLR